MPKQIKGNPRRKPPEPSTDHAAIESWFDDVVPSVGPLVRSVDASVREVVPDLQYAVKFHRAFYGLPERGWMIEVAPYFRSVNVLFPGGADLDPPPPLGETGRTRYVKITSVEQAQDPDVRRWIEQASHVPGWT